MNASNPAQRLRGQSNGAPQGSGGRPMQENRSGSGNVTINGSLAGVDRNGAGGQMSRAEKFEDEKRRIIESCFGKKEADGSISESYITHIRIEEDAAYPSSPPPRESPPENKKPRVIIIAVRKSGRVRMHKARENLNSTFSIGKTWVLDDLTAIESFTNAIPQTPEEQENKQRAGPTGFLVTVQKPYYWCAGTAKEKDFFIFSLVKIFKKYTGGRLPELFGFSAAELDQIGGASGVQAGARPTTQPPSAASNHRVASHESPAPRDHAPPMTQRQNSSRERRQRPSQERPPHEQTIQGRPPQERQLHSAVSHPLRTNDSNDRIHMPGSFPSSESIDRPSPKTSQHQLRPKGSQSPAPHNNRLQQPEFRRPGAGQSTDSFRSGQESFSTASGRSSNERSRQNGYFPVGVRSEDASHQRPKMPEDRPITAVRGPSDSYGNTASQVQETVPHDQVLNFNPEPRDQPSLQTVPVRSQPSKDDMRERSASGRGQNRAPRGPPSSNRSESSGDHPVDETRPTTASSHDIKAGQINHQEVSSSATSKNDDGIPTPQPISTNFPPTSPPETPIEEVHRPGLGPMIKKKSTAEVASKFRKAATAYNAFKPRAGGAAGKISDDKPSTGDGITGVFQAPSLLRVTSQDDSRPATPTQKQETQPSTPDVKSEIPAVSITTSPAKPLTTLSPEPTSQQSVETQKTPPESVKIQEDRRKKHRSDHSAKYAKTLGIDPSLLEGRTFEIESVLNDFGWGEESNERTNYEELQTSIRKELARVEAGSWLSTVESDDDRVAAVSEMMDKVIAECDELDGLLTLYNVELGTLSEDVAYIEAQSQGLQVQTANQKLLQMELRNLLDTISMSAGQLHMLKDASLAKASGIHEVEATLTQLYTAMLTIDPKLRHNDSKSVVTDQASLQRNSSIGNGGNELGSMLAVREKREEYRRESVDFIQRLKQFLAIKFRETETETQDMLESNRSTKTLANPTKLDHHIRDKPKADLWMYSPVILFVRDMETADWDDLMHMYEGCVKKPYQDEFRDNLLAWKRITRKPLGDEQDVLFTTQEKEPESIVGRKLTVKRSKTVRTDGSSRISSGDKPNDGKVTAYEAFAGALSETARIMFVEQNFIVDLFHASSLDSQDFLDATATAPEQRKGGELIVKKPFDPDRDMAKKVFGVMEEIFSFWPTEIQSLVNWATKQDPLNGIGVLFALESQLLELEETNQDFLSQSVSNIHDRLATLFTRFIQEQLRGIEDTKVKIKKRKGVIAFIKTFPNFSTTIENMLPPTRSLDHLPIRTMVNDAYTSILRAMFESLKFIAKESPLPTQTQSTVAGDPEDKEALNYHILLIENMNHYIEEVAIRNNTVLEDWNLRARGEMNEHMELYIAAVIRRPLGKLLDFLESTESLIRNNPGSPAAIVTRASHSRSTFKKILSNYDAKEIRRGIDTLKKRVEKHFGDGDDTPGLSRELITKVCKECEARYLVVGERVSKVAREVYEGSVEVEWRREDVVSAFRR